MATPPNIRVNLLAPFPSLVTGSGPIGIAKTNGNWQVSFNMAGIGQQSPQVQSRLAAQSVLALDQSTNPPSFVRIPAFAISSPSFLNVIGGTGTATISDTVSFSLGFNDYMFIFENVVPSTNNVGFNMQVQSAAAFQNTGYLNSAGGVTTSFDLLQATNLGNAADLGYSGILYLHGSPGATTTKKQFRGTGVYNTNVNAAAAANPAGWWNGGDGALTGVQFQMTAGNIASGLIKIYGFV